ncbi:MAG TPA: hypothetical protein VN805_11330 [Caulobacteraceae bacterium]|nr:hypothetical protein [Caulobacteraceae bacterium]
MAGARTDRFDPLAMPLTLAFAWTEAIGEMTRASISIWSAIIRSYGSVNEVYAALFCRAIDLEAVETLALTNSEDRLLQNELRVLEGGTEHLLYGAERTLAEMAGGPLIPLPE